MISSWAVTVWDLVKRTFAQWQAHRSAELASSLAFYAALALAGLALVATYVAATVVGRGPARSHATGQAGHIAGSHNAQVLDTVLRQSAGEHAGWVALVVGIVVFLAAVTGTALQLQSSLNTIWDVKPEAHKHKAAHDTRHHVPELLGIYALTLLLIVLLFAGATLHALTYHTHQLPALRGMAYQALDVGASIVVLTLVFACMFGYLPPVEIRWRAVWIGAFVSAVLYERGQFGLAFYLGQMDARSPYADAGAIVAVLVWLYYSAQVVLIGADFTKALQGRSESRREKRNAASQ